MKSLLLFLNIILLVGAQTNKVTISSDYNVNHTWTLKTFKFLGLTIKFLEKLVVQKGKVTNQIIVQTDSGSAAFGYSGVSTPITKSVSQSLTILKFTVPPLPTAQMFLKGSGSLSYSIQESSGKLLLTLNGSIYAQANVKTGTGISSISANSKGTIFNINRRYSILHQNTSIFGKINGGKITYNVKGVFSSGKAFSYDFDIFEGWPCSN